MLVLVIARLPFPSSSPSPPPPPPPLPGRKRRSGGRDCSSRGRKQIRAMTTRRMLHSTGLASTNGAPRCNKSALHIASPGVLFVAFASRIYALARCNEFEMVFQRALLSPASLLPPPLARSSAYSISCGVLHAESA